MGNKELSVYYHERADICASVAKARHRNGQDPKPDYGEAARMETIALENCEVDSEALSVMAASAAELWLKSGEVDRCLEFVEEWIYKGVLKRWAIDDLEMIKERLINRGLE